MSLDVKPTAAALPVALPRTLLQRWFSQTDHPAAGDPYFLYAASNAGSLLALLVYPLIVEPALPLWQQSRDWSFGLGLLALGIAFCWVGYRNHRITIPAAVEA